MQTWHVDILRPAAGQAFSGLRVLSSVEPLLCALAGAGRVLRCSNPALASPTDMRLLLEELGVRELVGLATSEAQGNKMSCMRARIPTIILQVPPILKCFDVHCLLLTTAAVCFCNLVTAENHSNSALLWCWKLHGM